MEPHLGHSLSLGCCGMCDQGASVYVSPINGPKCDYCVQLARLPSGTLVGINPRLAEHIVENCIQLKLLLPEILTYKREWSISKETRFDFGGTMTDGKQFYLEVKNVPLAKEREKAREKEQEKAQSADSSKAQDSAYNQKTAYFPEGYRKKKTDTVSPRALKHIQELMHIKQTTNARCIMVYVIQRNDVNEFEISDTDPEYRDAVQEAVKAGVEVYPIMVEWSSSGVAIYKGVL
jgi:DNA-binding sugar fermentation-stimulating protein